MYGLLNSKLYWQNISEIPRMLSKEVIKNQSGQHKNWHQVALGKLLLSITESRVGFDVQRRRSDNLCKMKAWNWYLTQSEDFPKPISSVKGSA